MRTSKVQKLPSQLCLSLPSIITNVTRENSGQYVCEATNNVTTVQSNSATLNVKCKITYYNYYLIIAKNTLKPVVSFIICNFNKIHGLYLFTFNVVQNSGTLVWLTMLLHIQYIL